MADALPPGGDWLLETLNRLEAQQVRSMTELRTEMREGFQRLSSDFKLHEHDDRKVADRVLTLENERDERRKQILSRTTIVALIAGLPGAALALYTLLHLNK